MTNSNIFVSSNFGVITFDDAEPLNVEPLLLPFAAALEFVDLSAVPTDAPFTDKF